MITIHTFRRSPAPAGRSSGFSFIELVASLSILVTGVLVIMATFLSSMRLSRESEDLALFTTSCRNMRETLRAEAFSTLTQNWGPSTARAWIACNLSGKVATTASTSSSGSGSGGSGSSGSGSSGSGSSGSGSGSSGSGSSGSGSGSGGSSGSGSSGSGSGSSGSGSGGGAYPVNSSIEFFSREDSIPTTFADLSGNFDLNKDGSINSSAVTDYKILPARLVSTIEGNCGSRTVTIDFIMTKCGSW